jgi:hypothetical protein
MSDPRLNQLLRWSVENSEATRNDPQAAPPTTQLTPDVMAALMGGPSEADLMRMSMEIITSSSAEVTLENKIIAWDNFEQLIESLDNANNLTVLKLWDPLLAQLKNKEGEMKKMAAWCIGTAVQNNLKPQETLLELGDAGLPTLVDIALGAAGENESVRRKGVYALSSACRNYQPAMDVLVGELGKKGAGDGKAIDVGDFEAVDALFHGLREKAAAA